MFRTNGCLVRALCQEQSGSDILYFSIYSLDETGEKGAHILSLPLEDLEEAIERYQRRQRGDEFKSVYP